MANGFLLRPATSSDLDCVTEIALAASATDPLDQYRYPFAATYPQDHEKLLRTRLRRYLWDADVGACRIIVAESKQGGGNAKVVGYAIWETDETHVHQKDQQNDHGKCQNNVRIDTLFTAPHTKQTGRPLTSNPCEVFTLNEPTISERMLWQRKNVGMTVSMGSTDGICVSLQYTLVIED